MDQLEGRNPVIEALQRRRRTVVEIFLDRGARSDAKIQRLLRLAGELGVGITPVDRSRLDRMAEGRVHNGVVARAEPLPAWTTRHVLDRMFETGRQPFFVLADQVQYEHNLGAILRSALGFGVDAVVLPTRRGASMSPVVQRVAMGAAEDVPVVREGLFSSMKHLKRAGVRCIGADMKGRPAHEVDLRGSIALVMGGEGRGLSSKLRQHCDEVVSVPLMGSLESLNVSVAAAVLMYEKRRQDGWGPSSSEGEGSEGT